MSTGFRSFITFLDTVGHIGSAVRAAEEFERSRSLQKVGKRQPGSCAATGIPL
ncbi:MAG: hypothetical protein QM636_17255 [Rhizobium sp.]